MAIQHSNFDFNQTGIIRPSNKNQQDPLATSRLLREKKFKCQQCYRGYSRLSDLKAHLDFQCGKEPRYACKYCLKKDKFSSNMYKHVRKLHKDKKLVIIDMYKQKFKTIPKKI